VCKPYLRHVFQSEAALRRQTHSLLELCHLTSGRLALPPLVRAMRAAACRLLDAEHCIVFLRSEDGTRLLSERPEAEGGALLEQPLGRGIAGRCAQSGEPINLPDAYADSRFEQEDDVHSGHRTGSLLCVAILPADRLVDRRAHGSRCAATLGVVQLSNKRGGAFTADDEALLMAVASHLAVAVAVDALCARDR